MKYGIILGMLILIGCPVEIKDVPEAEGLCGCTLTCTETNGQVIEMQIAVRDAETYPVVALSCLADLHGSCTSYPTLCSNLKWND